MSRVAVLGDPDRVAAWAVGGAVVIPVVAGADPTAAWESLEDDVEVVVLTAAVATGLGNRTHERLAVVLP